MAKVQNQKWSDTMGSYTCIFILGAEPLLNTKNGDMKIKGIEIDPAEYKLLLPKIIYNQQP